MLDYPWLASLDGTFDHWVKTGMPHAILVLGTEAVAQSVMQRCASYSLCNTACGHCHDCEQIKLGLHPAVTQLGFDDSTSIGVDAIRQLTQSLGLRSKQKQFVFIHASKLNQAASNAFLKSLEEPEGHVCFLLYASSAHNLLATLVSRCVQCVLPNPSFTQALAYLSNLGVSEQEASIALRRFGGCPLTALRFLEPEQQQEVLQVTEGFFALVDKKTDPVTVTEQWLKNKSNNALYLLHSLISDLCVLSSGAQNLVKNQHHMDKLEAVAKRIDFSIATRWMQAWQQCARNLQSPSANPKLAMLQFLDEIKT